MYTITFLLLALTVAIIGTLLNIIHLVKIIGILKRRVKSLESKLGLLFVLTDDPENEYDEHIQNDYGFYHEVKRLINKMYDEEYERKKK